MQPVSELHIGRLGLILLVNKVAVRNAIAGIKGMHYGRNHQAEIPSPQRAERSNIDHRRQ